MSQSPVPHRRSKTAAETFLIALLSVGVSCSSQIVRGQTAAPQDFQVDPAWPVQHSIPAPMLAPTPALGDGSNGAERVDARPTGLPDAPAPAPEIAPAESSSALEAPGPFAPAWEEMIDGGVSRGFRPQITVSQCPFDTTHAPECRPHWRQLLVTSSLFNAFQNTGNLYTGYWYRVETTSGSWFQRWFNSDLGWRWSQWHDGNPFLDDYVGHPMMGSITSYFWIQNDPKGMAVEFGNSYPYWRSRLASMVFSAAYSFEWKFGPFGEAGVGHNGDHTTDVVNGQKQNDTGDVELVTTPIGGFGWTIAEDMLDRYVVKRLEATPRSPYSLLLISFLTPARATANIFRFRPPWYRDGRAVKAKTFWTQPPGPYDFTPGDQPASGHFRATDPAAPEPAEGAGAVSRGRNEYMPTWPHYGGVHEFGTWWGLSLISGHIWGYAGDIKYMPIDVNYSYLINPDSTRWNFRYAPEITAVAMLDQPTPGATSATNKFYRRERIYGSGVSPVGFRASFYPDSRVQPYISGDGGFIYFSDRVLSPQGSQYMYTVDYGAGLQFFRKRRQSFSIGYRYQHLSNANISHHNPGTDANTFYLAISRFRSKGYR